MAKFYKPQNEKGHDLVPINEPKSTTITGFIDKSWLNTIDATPNTDGSDDNKFVLGKSLSAAIDDLESTLRTDIQGIKFKKQDSNLAGLKREYLDELETANDVEEKLTKIRQELSSTIFFVESNTGTDDNYAEYVCTNANTVSKTVDPIWEKIGETAQSAPQANATTLGLVKLADTIDSANDVSKGVATTPKAVATAIANKLDSVSLKVGTETITLNSAGSEATLTGSGAITVSANDADNSITIAATAASTSAAGIVQLTSDIDDGSDQTKAVTSKGVKDAIDEAIEEAIGDADIDSKLETITISGNTGSTNIDTDNDTLTIKGTSHITVTVADGEVTVSDTITNATTSAAGIVQLTSTVGDGTDETKAVTSKGVKDAITAAISAEGIDNKIDSAIDEAKEELEANIKTAQDTANQAKTTADDAKNLAEQAYETVYLEPQTITNGQVTITVSTTRNEKFIAAYIDGDMWIPDVSKTANSITLEFCKPADAAGITDGKTADILISRIVQKTSA